MEGMLMTTATTDTRASVLEAVVADLAAETHSLLRTLSRLRAPDWDAATPAEGWTIRDQLTHLAFFDDATLLALGNPAAFIEQRAELLALGGRFPDAVADRYRPLAGAECFTWFTRSRKALLSAYLDAAPDLRLPWYGPDMGLASSATGRLMETWAHGQDIIDALGEVRTPTVRLRHIADLGVRTFAFSFRLRARTAPGSPVRVELDGPDGGRWTWGPAQATDQVSGTALDFCLVVTQRRNLADTALRVNGPVATEWISIAQAFAGAPGPGRPPGLFDGHRADGRATQGDRT
jgi:uncharacterized protein (TIGR03084 family)